MSGRALQQAHHFDGLVGGCREPPLSGAGAEGAAHAIGASRLELLRRERTRRAGCNGYDYLGSRGSSVAVESFDPDLGVLRAGVHDPQLTHLVDVLARVEDGHIMPIGGLRDQIVHAGEESVFGADVGQYLEHEGRTQREALEVDEERLELALEAAERGLAGSGRAMDFTARAKLVAGIYQLIGKDKGQANAARMRRLIAMVAGDDDVDASPHRTGEGNKNE